MNEPRSRWVSTLLQRSVPELLRVACVLALLGLAIMIYPLVFPSALGIVLSMGVGHVIGFAAAGLYVLAVVLDMARRRDQ